MDQEVRWLLTEKLLQVRTGPVHPNDDVVRRRSRALTAFDSTLEALRYVGAISEVESVAWRNNMWRALGLDHAGVEPGRMQMLYLADGEPPHPEPIRLVPQYPRKTAGPRDALGAFDGLLRIAEVEYDDSVTVLRWQIEPLPDVDAAFADVAAALEVDIAGMDDWAIEHFRDKSRQALRHHRMRQLDLDDDVGTEYTERPVSAKSGGPGGVTGITAFTPGTPSHAEQLVVHWLGSSLTVRLT